MKTHPLTAEQIDSLLNSGDTATLATVNADGTPYVVPIHFVYMDGYLYFHGLPAGQKISNIRTNPHISFNTYQMDGLLLDAEEKPCDTNTRYTSVNVQGTAKRIDDLAKKQQVLEAVISKYTPQLAGKSIPSNMLKGTAVIEITIEQITGKYYN